MLNKKKVTFSPSSEWEIIKNDPELSKVLIEYRTSDLASRIADKCRYETLLKPIFDTEHRKKIWKILYENN